MILAVAPQFIVILNATAQPGIAGLLKGTHAAPVAYAKVKRRLLALPTRRNALHKLVTS